MSQGPPPPTAVLDAFGLDGAGARPLPGGQGQAWRVDGWALKPCGDADEAAWLSAVLEDVREDGFRIARPRRTRAGAFVCDGWCASAFLVGDPGLEGRWRDAIAACRAFHRAVAAVSLPSALLARANPYRDCEAIAWGERPRPDEALGPAVAGLFARWQPIAGPTQLVHGDPGDGNMLFADGLAPALIDIAPCQRPAAYATAMLLSDGVAWSGAPIALLHAELAAPGFDQLVLRAVLYRICIAGLVRRDAVALARRIAAYAPVIAALAR